MNMILAPRLLSLLATGTLAMVPAVLAQNSPAAPPANPAAKDETVQMSVFEVTTSKDIGYQSTNAAEVTRMNTPIENIPINVTIFNQQFIEDLLATDTSEEKAKRGQTVHFALGPVSVLQCADDERAGVMC